MRKINNELVNFLTESNRIKGVSFASIKGYENSKGEIANHLINLGATLGNAKVKDLKEFKELNLKNFYEIKVTDKEKFSFELMQKAYINVYNSLVKIGDKLHDGTIKVQNKRSKGQTDAYTVINSSVKVHNEFERLYVYALRIKKDVLVKGVYPKVNSRALTLAQNLLKKGMLHTKFTMYIIEKADVMNFAKTQFSGENLSIDLS